MHPNLFLLLKDLHYRLNDPGKTVIDDPSLFLNDLPLVPAKEKGLVLLLLFFAAVVDGKVTFREKRLLRRALEGCGLPPEPYLLQVKELKKTFILGRLSMENITNLINKVNRAVGFVTTYLG